MADTANVRSPVILNAGLSAAVAANGSGASIQITHIALGNGKRVITGGETGLASEAYRSPISGSAKVAPTTWQVFSDFDIGAAVFSCTEIGFYAGSQLFAYYSILPTSSDVIFNLSNLTATIDYSIDLSVVPAGSVTILIDDTASLTNLLVAQHIEATDPHSQYLTKSEYYAQDHKNSAIAAITSSSVALSGIPTAANADGVTLAAGDRVLRAVTPADAANGLYVVAAGAWTRAADANESTEVTSGMEVAIEQGTLYKDSKWTLTTDGAIVLGTTALLYVMTQSPYAGAGKVDLFAGNAAPIGWLKANGALVSRTAYAVLFAAIGTTYGAGDGSTTFALPDLRGQFLRVFDDGRGVDAGRVFGSTQEGTWLRTLAQEWTGNDTSSVTYSVGSAYAQPDARINTAGVGGGFPAGAVAPSGGGYSNSTTDNTIQGTAYVADPASPINNWIRMRPNNVSLLACIKY